MTKNFDIAKKNFDRGIWTEEMLSNLVGKGKLSATEYEEITGNPYSGQVDTIPKDELDEAYAQGVHEA